MSVDLGKTGFELDGDTGVRITRVVAAPPELVFDVHTSPAHLPKWMLGPPGWTMPVCEIDLRPGGAFRYVWVSGGGEELTIAGAFETVDRPTTVVSTESWGPEWPATRNTLTFTPVDGGARTRITTEIAYPSAAARDAAVQSGMREGLDATYTNLDAHLTTETTLSMRLELVPVPVKDVDTALAFYRDKLGWTVDHDLQPPGARIVQLTPTGSACSVLLAHGLPGFDTPPGVLRALHLVVADIKATRTTLLARGVDCGEVDDMGGILYVHFADPDGNTWLLQEIPPRVYRPEGL